MRATSGQAPSRVAVVGAGVIGAGWAARFVLGGIDVGVFDPDARCQERVEATLDRARSAQRSLIESKLPGEGSLDFASSLKDALLDAEFIQESLPEDEALKCRTLREISDACDPQALIVSSTSGIRPSRLQSSCASPERVCVGHPFNPVYLLPLVEVVGGALTSEACLEQAARVYRFLGMHPLVLNTEIDGFIADRLLEAMWREALHLVKDGIATADEIDQAIIYGPGLRFSFMGSFLLYRLGGGEQGMRHFLEQFGPALKLPWTRLPAPELDETLIERIVAQSEDQAAGRSIGELEALRDDCLVSILRALREQDHAAGSVLKAYEDGLGARA